MNRPSTITATRRPTAAASKGRLVGIWRLTQRVHAGLWTDIYRAQPAETMESAQADYAVKIVNEGSAADQAHGAQQVCASIEVAHEARHPNLQAVLDGGVDGSTPYVVSPWIEGVNLQQWMTSHPWPRLPVCLWWIRQCAQGLNALHAAGWRHGDTKPENVVLTSRGHATLIDLGFARRLGAASVGQWERCGTLEYAAPELLRGERLSAATDLYALGIMLWQLTNQVSTASEALNRIVGLESSDNPIDQLIWELTSWDPQRRPSATSTADRLLRLEIESLGDHIRPRSKPLARAA